ncbi:MAG: oligosaccharide flippase family protein [Chitinophagaceae bacterium]
MSSVKKLAGQTIWYGASSIFARFLNYLLTPYLTLKLSGVGYGEMSLVYAMIPFLNVIFTYGLETAYFRFVQREETKKDLYDTGTVSLICSTIVLTIVMVFFSSPLAKMASIEDHPEYITLSAFIIAFDALTTLAFSRLRQEGRPVKFAVTRIASILVNIAVIYFFISVCPAILKKNPGSFLKTVYDPSRGVLYVIIANLASSFVTFILLSKEFFSFKWRFNSKLWKEMLVYSLPLLVAGFGGIINETFDRIMLGWWSPAATEEAAKFEVGMYSACYKLSILITLFIQAFKMGAEPFFFNQAKSENPQRVYARVMKFFVITISLMFLAVSLFLDEWKYFIRNPAMYPALKVVPVLLLANMFLGIYYNLSIWYKVTNKTMAGAWITVAGAAITLTINYFFIPVYSYAACAWATFFCYGFMMVMSYIWGQKLYPVPYAWKKLCSYMVIAVMLYFLHRGITYFLPGFFIQVITGFLLMTLYVLFILRIEKKEFQKLPVIGKFL